MSTKGSSEFSLICLDLELFAKNKKTPGFYQLQETRFFTFLLITQDLNKLEKIPNTFLEIVAWEMSVKFQQKLLNYMVAGSRQNVQFFRQIN